MGNSRDSETLISQQLRTVIASLPDLLESYSVTAQSPTILDIPAICFQRACDELSPIERLRSSGDRIVLAQAIA